MLEVARTQRHGVRFKNVWACLGLILVEMTKNCPQFGESALEGAAVGAVRAAHTAHCIWGLAKQGGQGACIRVTKCTSR